MTSLRVYHCHACGQPFIKTDDALFTRFAIKCPHCGSHRTERAAETTVYELVGGIKSGIHMYM